MPKLFKRLFWPDTHTPHHDVKAVNLLLDVLVDFKPDEVVLLGDIFDIYCLSQYDQDPVKAYGQLEMEIGLGVELMNKAQKLSPKANFVFLEGNHEQRIERYINVYGGKLKTLIQPTRDILKLPKTWKYLPYGQNNFYRMPGLVATHGTITSKHPAHAAIQKYGCSIIQGHTHKLQMSVIRNLDGKEFRGFSAGWLGDQKTAAEYIKDCVDWSLGFALGVWTEKEFFIELVHIQNYKAVAHGKVYPS